MQTERAPLSSGRFSWDAPETPILHSLPLGEGGTVNETLQALIAGITAGAAEGAAALRRNGLAVELDAYTVEARIDGDGGPPSASIRVDFVVPPRRAGVLLDVVGEAAPIGA